MVIGKNVKEVKFIGINKDGTGKITTTILKGRKILESDVNFDPACEELSKEINKTLPTDGHRKIIDNGKRQWPAAKQRKGHR